MNAKMEKLNSIVKQLETSIAERIKRVRDCRTQRMDAAGRNPIAISVLMDSIERDKKMVRDMEISQILIRVERIELRQEEEIKVQRNHGLEEAAELLDQTAAEYENLAAQTRQQIQESGPNVGGGAFTQEFHQREKAKLLRSQAYAIRDMKA